MSRPTSIRPTWPPSLVQTACFLSVVEAERPQYGLQDPYLAWNTYSRFSPSVMLAVSVAFRTFAFGSGYSAGSYPLFLIAHSVPQARTAGFSSICFRVGSFLDVQAPSPISLFFISSRVIRNTLPKFSQGSSMDSSSSVKAASVNVVFRYWHSSVWAKSPLNFAYSFRLLCSARAKRIYSLSR